MLICNCETSCENSDHLGLFVCSIICTCSLLYAWRDYWSAIKLDIIKKKKTDFASPKLTIHFLVAGDIILLS